MVNIISSELITLDIAMAFLPLTQNNNFIFSVCWGGYEKVGDSCVACPVGTFRWPDNPETCQTCPEGTTTTITGRWQCGMYEHPNKMFFNENNNVF